MSGIIALQQAEQEAVETIRLAKREKVQMLQVAKERARTELEQFKKGREDELAEIRANMTSNDSYNEELAARLDSIVRDIDNSMNREMNGMLDYIMTRVMTVNPKVPSARIRV